MIKNKKVYYNYEVILEINCGVKLIGSEIKPLREGNCQIDKAFCYILDNEIFIKNMYIADNKNAKHYAHEPLRDRKLLLKKKEIRQIQEKIKIKGLTIIPLMVFENEHSMFKLKIGVCRGKNTFDKKESIKKKDLERELNLKLK